MRRYLIAAAAGLSISLGTLSILIGIHDVDAQEDTKVIWVCSVQGNKVCGADTPAVIVRLSNLYI